MAIRLLNTTNGRFKYEDPLKVRYAILSHVWQKKPGHPPEQSHQEVRDIAARKTNANSNILPLLSEKIRNACDFARQHGFTYIWIDTCCIDQTSSAELSRSINSMYEWYSCANVCYVYLHDVDSTTEYARLASQFRRSRWFTRGWTLQELIAPRNVIFLSSKWRFIGTKHSMMAMVQEITGIDRKVLQHKMTPSEVPVAQRMRWVAGRDTELLEDQAYCLIGIFGVRLTPIYGEGEDAFFRLQEAILKSDPDQTIFAWGERTPVGSDSIEGLDNSFDPTRTETYVLAQHPANFSGLRHMQRIRPLSRLELAARLPGVPVGYPQYTYTSSGLRTSFPLIRYKKSEQVTYWLAILACEDENYNLLALLLNPDPDGDFGSSPGTTSEETSLLFVGATSQDQAESSGRLMRPLQPGGRPTCYRLVTLLPSDIEYFLQQGLVEPNVEMYIKHRPLGHDLVMRRYASNTVPDDLIRQGDRAIQLTLSKWSSDVLFATHNYIAKVKGSRCQVELKRGPDEIIVTLGRCECTSGYDESMRWLCVRVLPELPERTHVSCHQTHIVNWRFEDGTAHAIYGLRPLSDTSTRELRLSLSIEAPLGPDDHPAPNPAMGSPGLRPHSRDVQFILDIELLISTPGLPMTPQPPAFRKLESEVGSPRMRHSKARKTLLEQGPPVPVPAPQAGMGGVTYTNTNPGR